jgi:hypothetical protein
LTVFEPFNRASALARLRSACAVRPHAATLKRQSRDRGGRPASAANLLKSIWTGRRGMRPCPEKLVSSRASWDARPLKPMSETRLHLAAGCEICPDVDDKQRHVARRRENSTLLPFHDTPEFRRKPLRRRTRA